VVHAVGKPDEREHLPRAPLALLRPDARVDQRQLDVLLRVEPREKLRVLEHEADLAAADARELELVEVLDAVAVERVLALGRLVEAADDVHERRFAASRGAEHRQVLAPLNVQVDAPEHDRVLVAHFVDLCDAAHAKEFSVHRATYMPPGIMPPPVPPPKLSMRWRNSPPPAPELKLWPGMVGMPSVLSPNSPLRSPDSPLELASLFATA